MCDWFQIDDHRFGVRTTSPAFGEWIRYALGAYLVDGPGDVDDDPRYSLVVEDGTSNSGRAAKKLHIFYEGTLDIVRSLDVRVVARSFLSEIESITFPNRDDAVYLEASVMRGGGKTVLIPSLMVPALSKAGRRIQSSVDVALPTQLSVALDLFTGHLIPTRRSLDIPADVLEAIGRYITIDEEKDTRAIVDEELSIDRVVVWPDRSAPGVAPPSRGSALFRVARSILNLPKVGGDGVLTVGRALAEAEALEARWADTRELVDLVATAMNGGRYVLDRTEVTSRGP